MAKKENILPLVYTIKERCRICYTCVRECPAKAIKIGGGQAEVMPNRCIGCGNCVKVCSQDAKQYFRSIDKVMDLIQSDKNVIACIAPSFPAEFMEYEDYKTLVGMIRNIGFSSVHEVAFGADIVALKYKNILEKEKLSNYISSDCPAVVTYIEKYSPDLVKNLIPIVSPMEATARVLKEIYGKESNIVFIGPCIAKKTEMDEISEVITFRELRELFFVLKITPKNSIASEFDEPLGGKGALFPLSMGLLHNIESRENILKSTAIVADGRLNFDQAIKEAEQNLFKTDLLELLCCNGCFKGVGMSPFGKTYSQISAIKRYAQKKAEIIDLEKWQKDIDRFSKLDYSRNFKQNDQRILFATNTEIKNILTVLGKENPSDHLNCGACGYETCIDHAIAIYKGIAEQEMCLPFTIEKLHKYNEELSTSNDKLANIQLALRQSEKLAHMGQLSAGIAHELNNPLGVVIMYSNILLDECPPDSPLRKDLELITHQAERCKTIVRGLLNFARTNQVRYEMVDTNELIKETLNAIIVPSEVNIEIQNNINTSILIDKEQMIQSLTNLIKNAIEAMNNGGKINLILKETSENYQISIKDNGKGIEKENLDKLFTPFFTTKAIGSGTGLGLPTVYGIVKMHKGDLTVQSNVDPKKGPTGTTFTIILPKKIN